MTTARDLSILARDIVVNYPEDQSFFEVQEFNFRGRRCTATTRCCKSYSGATGMKTGYTDLAGTIWSPAPMRNGARADRRGTA